MPFSVTVTVNRSFKTTAPFETVFELLADVQRSGSFFPNVEALTALGDEQWKWELERIGIGEYTLQQSVYASRYESDREKGTVVWTPVREVGNAVVGGSWTVVPEETGSEAALYSKGTLEVNLPGFLEILLAPLIRLEFERLVDRYVENLERELSRPERPNSQ